MWHKVRQLLMGPSAVSPDRLSSSASHQDQNALQQKGYLMPQTATSLLETGNRQYLLKQLWENSLLPQTQYEQYFLTPLKSCVSLMQELPATASDHHAVQGGMVDYTLKTVVYAARLSRGYMLPPGASAEEQSAQSAAWGAVVFYSALFHSLSSLRQIEGELLDGELWYPGINVPGQPYRFRFRATIPEGAGEGLCTMLGMRLLPGEVILWLSKTPQALDTLLSFLRGDFDRAGVIYQIVEDAIVHAGGTPREAISQTSVIASHSHPVQAMAATNDPPDAPAMALVPPVAQSGEASLPSGVNPPEAPALTSALDENNPLPVTAVPAGQEEEDPAIQAVMSLMGFEPAPPAEEAAPESHEQGTLPDADTGVSGLPGAVSASPPAEELSPTAEPDTDVSEDYGGQFVAWLKTKMLSGEMAVNTKEAQIHIVGGLIFLPAPAVFFSFMKDCAYCPSLKNDVQRGFERLGLHFIHKGKGMYSCLKYENENRTGGYEKVSGYLIKSKIIYVSHPVPDDSLFLFVSGCK